MEESNFIVPSTGCNSEIWKEVQVKIYCIYNSTETNRKPTTRLSYDSLNKIAALKKSPREDLESKESKNLHAYVKNQQSMLFVERGRGILLILTRLCPSGSRKLSTV